MKFKEGDLIFSYQSERFYIFQEYSIKREMIAILPKSKEPVYLRHKHFRLATDEEKTKFVIEKLTES